MAGRHRHYQTTIKCVQARLQNQFYDQNEDDEVMVAAEDSL